MEPMEFTPLECLLEMKSSEKIALVILNKDIKNDNLDSGEHSLFVELWKKSLFRVCADGGANFVYDWQHKHSNGIKASECIPDLISGDFDSIRPEVKEYYENEEKTTVVHTPDQDETDFTKALEILAKKIDDKELNINLVVTLGGRQNRFDHSVANISTLYKAKKIFPKSVRTCLLYGESYICMLSAGKSILNVDTGLEGDWCGLVPIGGPVIVTTSGLKWNLNEDKLEFGHLVSTSNELDDSKQVTVEANAPLIWTMAFRNT